MSVNLKGRKSAQADQADAPAPQELAMAGAQTPWATEQPSGSPFAEQGMPTMPPPPPPYAPGEEPAEAEAGGKKSPFSKPMILALVAVIAVGGGGYYYLNMGSSSSSTPAAKTTVLTPAQLAALRAKGAAKPAAAAAAGAAAKPAVSVVKPGTTAKAVVPAKPAPTAKTVAPPAKAAAAPAAGTTRSSTTSSPSAVYTAALPGAINGWDKLIGAKVPNTLASYDATVGASLTDVQEGLFGDTATDPYLAVTVAEHSPNAKGKAIDVLRGVLTFDRNRGIAVSPPFFVSHAGWGGSAACASEAAFDKAGTSDESVVVCSWIDANTVGVITAPHRIASQALPLLNSVRSQVEH